MKYYKYTKIMVVIIALLMLTTISCPKKETGINGRLILQTGQTGDVRNTRVLLYVSSDLTGTPVKEVASDATGVDQTKAEFEFTDVVEGYYYLLAWKDLNGSGDVDNNDIVGIHGGTYTPGYGGTQVTVTDGNMTDVGDIVMLIYKELIMTLSGVRDNNGWLDFTYSFNDDCTVSSWSLTIPGGQSASDPTQNGAKTAGTQYHSDDWAYSNGDPLPAGNYIVSIAGTWGTTSFSIAETLYIAK
jgi:uncharacterized protein (DUF2141 family)